MKSKRLVTFLLASLSISGGVEAFVSIRVPRIVPSPPIISSSPSQVESAFSSRSSPLLLSVKSEGKKRLATGMAFLTGWADVLLFLKYKAFATMMTGNTMWMALAAIEQRYKDTAFYASVIISYLVGLAAFRKADLSLREKSIQVCALGVMILFVGSDIIHHITSTRWIPIMMLATGYGVVNSVGTEVAGTLTFVVTGHLTRLTNQAVDRVSRAAGRKKLTPQDKAAAVQNAAVFGGFLAGALWACFLLSQRWLMRSGVFSLLGILYGLLFLWQDMEAMGGAWWLRKNGAMCDLDDDGGLCED